MKCICDIKVKCDIHISCGAGTRTGCSSFKPTKNYGQRLVIKAEVNLLFPASRSCAVSIFHQTDGWQMEPRHGEARAPL